MLRLVRKWIDRRAALAAGALAMAVFLPLGEGAFSQEPQEGGTLTIAVEADLREADHLQVRITVDKLIMGSTVYDALFQTDENGAPQPALIEEATPSSDSKEWTFKVREGVKFHNGKTFTAADVVANLKAYLDPANASNVAGDLENIASVEAVGEYEVKIGLKEPNGNLPATFMDGIYMADMDSYDGGEHPVGTGPYKWSRRVFGDRLTFTRFEDHWRGRPPLDEVTFRVIPTPEVAALELEAGGVDIVPMYISPDALPGLRRNADIQIYESPGGTVYQALFNFEKERKGGYADAAAFREGLAYLWNAQTIVPAMIGEFGELATQVLPPWQAGYDPTVQPWPYDPERGKELLAKAGVNEGDEIFLAVWTRPYLCEVATALQSQLIELGYEVRLECLAPETGMGTVHRYDWDLLFVRLSSRATAAATFHYQFRSGLAAVPDDFYTLRSEAVDTLIAEMLATSDPADLESLAREATRLVVREEIATLPAYVDKVRIAARNRVKGVKVSPIGYYGMLMNQIGTVYIEE